MTAISGFYNSGLSRYVTFPLEPFLKYKAEETVEQVVAQIKFAPLKKEVNGQEVPISFEATLGHVSKARFIDPRRNILKFVATNKQTKMGEAFANDRPILSISVIGNASVTADEIENSLWQEAVGKEAQAAVKELAPPLISPGPASMVVSYL